MPMPSAASASPAIRPPPTSDVVLMSSGSFACALYGLVSSYTKRACSPRGTTLADYNAMNTPPNDDA